MHANEKVKTKRVEPSKEVVCVLGASGYITSWLVNLLLQHEHSINATVRDPRKCFFFFAFTIPLSDNVLGSYAKVPSIKGVLITFSIAAVILIGKLLADDVVVDETWFSDPVVCEKLKVFDFLLSPLIIPLKK
ncbi:hypothetical protein Goarm_021293 [Gossypium armourianum]|uniref:NAD-dependent epimerase/dehydratase domain-containing protein n=1 Tax=Gossypium armourianum TaxID=34283 RepID=A0A7J9IS70_9ROSI|nr:hypothetical protein [Gossypium armourianum]